MYVYCICPHGNLKTNFIKIGICTKPESLKKRYTTYYGYSYKYYCVKVENTESEYIIHRKLKEQRLHIENELFVYNEKYDFSFYVQQLNEIHKEDEYSEIEDVVRKVKILNIKKDSINRIVENEDTEAYEDDIKIKNKFMNNYEKFIKENIKIPKVIKKIENIILELKEVKDENDYHQYINIPGLYEIVNKLIYFNNILKNIYFFYNL